MRSSLWVLLAVLVACSSRRDELEKARPVAARAPEPVRPGRADFVGSAACGGCHVAQSEAFAGSHHAKALVTPSAELAKQRFAGARFQSKLGGSTEFSLGDEGPVVTTRAAGASSTFPIRYVAGVWPLEQYVVGTERGKLQTLGVSFDTREHTRGARWFHVVALEGVAPSDSLFFTSPTQNWNHMCAECHSTWLERRYDAQTDSFDTRWAELSVGCEACHGPGAAHVRSAQKTPASPTPMPARLQRSPPWVRSPTGNPAPHAQDGVEVEVCAPCHSRRAPLKEGFLASDPFLDSFEPELLVPGGHHADGQVEGEVYEWASFLQSRMYRAGVRCSDCHEPHAGKLLGDGNGLCVRCHEPARFDVEAHTHHARGKAPSCIDCHMPPATFMQIDERRDHSIRIPRPDLSVALGAPNACSGCHAKESAHWAEQKLAAWFPASKPPKHFAAAFAQDRKGALDAGPRLREIAEEPGYAAIARAAALERLATHPGAKTVQTLRAALQSPEPLVVYGAVLGTAQLPLEQRGPLLVPLLAHPRRAVRVAVARLLAGVPASSLPEDARAARERAFAEVMQSFAVGASRPEAHVEQSAFEFARGLASDAERSLDLALRRSPCLAEAHLNRADFARQRGDEAAAERALRTALACRPESAAVHHALGLWYVRAHRPAEALESLRRAVALSPSDVRFRYVLAVAEEGAGRRREAIDLLEATLRMRPNDANSLQALASYLQKDGKRVRSAEVQRTLASLLRD